MTCAAPGREDRAGQAAGSGPDLDHGRVLERPGRAGDAAGEVEVEQEVLAERFLGREAMAAHHIAQGRQIVDLAHGRMLVRGSRAASFIAAIRLSGRRDALAGDVECGAVVGRGAHEGQPSVTFTASSKAIVLIGISAWS